jgi:eukaryotic-like serine/threonine-protein kinase
MGVVHEALDEATGARVAVKLVHAEMIRDASAKDDASKLTRFLREAKAAAAIQGEHVARTLDWGTDESTGHPFIVMELLEGEDLSVALKRVHVLAPDVALRIAAQACEGLLQAHLARVTHRDIKPANLFLARTATGEITVKILDFGIAKIRPENDSDGETTALTRTGSMLGSPKYMSPEQARGSRTLDGRTDLWSLGVVLYRALTGHLPHEDTTAIGEFIIVLCSELPPLVQSLAPWVPDEIARIVEDALQIDRDQRYENAEAMLAAIRALLPNGERLRVEEIAPFTESARTGMPSLAPGTSSGVSGSRSRTGSRSMSSSSSTSRSGSRSERSSRPDVTSSAAATLMMPPGRSLPPPGGARKDDSATPSSMANTQLEPGSPLRRRTLPFALGSGAVILVGLVVALSRGMVLSSNRPATSAEGSTSPAPTASGGAARQANLVILPDGVLVEIDGAPTAPVGGIVKISGAVGSTHRVRISKDGQEKITDVLIGPSGAEPPKVELVLPAAPSATAEIKARPPGDPRPQPKKPAASSAPAAPHAPTAPRNPLIPERFE